MKVLLAKLLLEKPDILLLDEPTNYLDAEHIAWLKRYLQEYENAFILISHDIPFLNDVVNIIYHMENQRLDRYVGDYDKFQEVYEVKKSQLEAAYRKQQQEISELKDFVARNKARVATRNMAMSRQKKLDKMDVIELAAERPKPEFNFKLGRTPGRYIFETKDLVIGYDEPLSKPLNISMERGHKIALVGANGIGKTTLLKSILGLIPSLGGSVELGENLEIGYFEQEIKGENRNTCIDEIWEEFPSFSQYEVRSALAKCGLTTKHIESLVRVLSGGEQAKVRLCKLINKSTNILLLDEHEETTGISAKTITAAIKRGYIPDNFADAVGTSATSPYYLNPQQAAVCWYKSLNSAHPNQRKVRNALAGYIKTFDKAVIEPEPTAKAVATATMTYEDAQLQEKIAKARIAELELQEKEGALVSRERINAQLFAAGKELRDTLLAIPDRITDVVMAEDNRAIVHNTIYDAIADALQKLADFQTRINQ